METKCILNDNVLNDTLQSDPELKNVYYQEKLILEVTETIAKLMHKNGVSKSELAKRLGKGRSYVTQLLDGTCNMTLRTISDVFVSLNSMLIPQAGSLSLEVGIAYEESDYEFEDDHKIMKGTVELEQFSYSLNGSNHKDNMAA